MKASIMIALAVATPAYADKLCDSVQAVPAEKSLDGFLRQHIDGNPPCHEAPRFAFRSRSVELAPGNDSLESSLHVANLVIAPAGSDVAWAAMDLWAAYDCVEEATPDMMGDVIVCPKDKRARIDSKWGGTKSIAHQRKRMTGLFEKRANGWQPVAWHYSYSLTAKEHQDAIKRKLTFDSLPRSVAGAEDVVKLFETTARDPKAFAKTVSERKDTVLYGSEPGERVVGGAAVRAKLEAWSLVLTVQGGIRAGLAANKSVAWLAANVTAGNSKVKPMPYRLLAIYERAGASWKLVQAHFSYVSDRDDQPFQ